MTIFRKISPSPYLMFLVYIVALGVYCLQLSLILLILINLPVSATPAHDSISYIILIPELLLIVVLLTCLTWLLRRQHIHRENQSLTRFLLVNRFKNSYLQFTWLGLILAPVTLLMVQHTAYYHELIVYEGLNPYAWAGFCTSIGLSTLFAGLYYVGGYWRMDYEPLRFAPGSTTDDEFGYGPVAVQDMRGLINSDKHVVVARVDGRLGEGKSSYLRMMVTSRPQEEFLYTYISLTETNEVKSFSKLFAERWTQTIAERYPSVSESTKQSILDNIFRESSNGWLKVMRDVVQNTRWPLRRTRIHAPGDTHKRRDRDYANSTTAALFAYVPYFYEDYWVIVIDEI